MGDSLLNFSITCKYARWLVNNYVASTKYQLSVKTAKKNLSQIAHMIPWIRRLDLSGCFVHEEALKYFLRSIEGLEELIFDRCTLDDEVLAATFGECSTLQTISFSSSTKKKLASPITISSKYVGDKAMVAIIRSNADYLQSLNLSNCTRVSDKTLQAIQRYCKRLKHLRFRNTSISDKGLRKLAMSSLQLETLDLSYCTKISSGGFQQLVKSACMASLIELDVYSSAELLLEEIPPNCKRLEVLSCGSGDQHYPAPNGDRVCIALSENCLELRELRYICVKSITAAGLVALGSHCTNIEILYLDRCCKTNISLPFPNLLELNIRGGKTVQYQISDQVLVDIASHCKVLTDIDLSFNQTVTDEGLIELVTSCTRLKRIRVNDCPSLTDKSVDAMVTNCPNLEELALSQSGPGDTPSPFSDFSLQSLEAAKKLRTLDLSFCSKITLDGMLQFLKVSSVTFIDIYRMRFDTNDLRTICEIRPKLLVRQVPGNYCLFPRPLQEVLSETKQKQATHLTATQSATNTALPSHDASEGNTEQ